MSYSQFRRLTSQLIASALCSFALAAHADATRYLLALSKTDHTLAIVDPVSLKVLDRLPVGPNPHEIAVSTDGRYAYVSNPGNNDLHQIDVLDLVHRKALPSLDTLPLLGPHGMQYRGGKLWFTAQGSKAIGRFDATTRQLEWAMGTGQDFTHLIHVAPDAQAVYTTNASSGTVSIFNHVLKQPTVPASGKLPPTARTYWEWEQYLGRVEQGSEGFDVTPDGRELWTVSAQGVVSIIDPERQARIAALNTGIEGAHRLKFAQGGKKAVIVSVKTGAVVYFDVATRAEIARTMTKPGDTILLDPVENRLFVSCPLDDVVAVIDNVSARVVSYLDVGGRPDGLAFADVPDQ